MAGTEGDLYISIVGKCDLRHFDDEEYVLRERESSGIAIVTRSKKCYRLLPCRPTSARRWELSTTRISTAIAPRLKGGAVALSFEPLSARVRTRKRPPSFRNLSHPSRTLIHAARVHVLFNNGRRPFERRSPRKSCRLCSYIWNFGIGGFLGAVVRLTNRWPHARMSNQRARYPL